MARLSNVVEIYHPGLDATSKVPASTVDGWRARGWIPADERAPVRHYPPASPPDADVSAPTGGEPQPPTQEA